MSIKLHLNEGDKVRNIRANSSRNGLIGFVEKIQRDAKRGDKYLVKWSTGAYGTYFVELAHHSIEAVVDQKAARREAKAISFFQRYHGQPMDFGTAYRDMSMMNTEDRDCILRAFMSVTGQKLETKRRVLKKVRRNVITGKTQDDMVREMGHARGVQQFNTRCIGRSTGQALRIIGDAMCNPTTEIRIRDIDHAISQGIRQRMVVNEHFRRLVQSLIGNMKGFTFTDTHIVFNPIVTEETYVETR